MSPAAGHGHRTLGTGTIQVPSRDPGDWYHPPRCQLYLVVHGNPVGPADADVDQHHPLGAVQARALDAGVLSPLCPEQVPEGTAGMSPGAALSEGQTPPHSCPHAGDSGQTLPTHRHHMPCTSISPQIQTPLLSLGLYPKLEPV